MGPAVTDHPGSRNWQGNCTTWEQSYPSFIKNKTAIADCTRKVIESGKIPSRWRRKQGHRGCEILSASGLNEDDILKAVEKVAAQGIKQLKLYFMIGLPEETMRNIESIALLVTKCKDIFDQHQSWSRITLTIAPFVPKAGTPFQQEGMAGLEILKHRLSLLKSKLTARASALKMRAWNGAEVQAVLSRGDERLAAVLANVERLSLAQWHRALEKAGLDIDFFAHSEVGYQIKYQ